MNSRKSRRKSSERARRKKKVARAKELGLELGESPIYQETQVYDYIIRISLDTSKEFRNMVMDEKREVDVLRDSKVITYTTAKGKIERKAVPYSIKVVDTHDHLAKRPVIKYVKKKPD